jgi:hypothetical protein
LKRALAASNDQQRAIDVLRQDLIETDLELDMLQRLKKYSSAGSGSEGAQRSVSTERPTRDPSNSRNDLTSAVRDALDSASRVRSDVLINRTNTQVIASSSRDAPRSSAVATATPLRDGKFGSTSRMAALSQPPIYQHDSTRSQLDRRARDISSAAEAQASLTRSKSASASDRAAPPASVAAPQMSVFSSAALDDGSAVRKRVKATIRKN